MKASNQLFQLIKSLSKPEKRYFHLFASAHQESSSYLILFDYINKLENYDEKKVKEHFKNESFSNQFAVTKHALYQVILKSMTLYHSEHSISIILREMLSSANFLFEKTHLDECNTQLKKAKKIAYKFEKFEILLDILKLEKKLNTVEANNINLYNDALRIQEEQKEIIQKIDNINDYWILSRQISMLMIKYIHLRTEKEKAEVRKIIEHPLMLDINNALSFQSKVYYHQIVSYYYRLIGETEKSSAARIALLNQWEKQEYFSKEDPAGYIHAVKQVLNIQLDGQKFEEFTKTIEKLKKIKSQSESIKLSIFNSYYQQKLVYHINTLSLKSNDFVNESIEEMGRLKNKLSKEVELTMCYLLAMYFFMQCDYKSSLKWNNQIMNDASPGTREDLKSFSKILNLMIHYELKNYDLLEYILKSTYKHLLKMEHLHLFEKAILKFIHQLPKTNTRADIIPHFTKLRDEFTELEKNPNEDKVTRYFDFIAWLDSKIENKPFVEIVKRKTK